MHTTTTWTVSQQNDFPFPSPYLVDLTPKGCKLIFLFRVRRVALLWPVLQIHTTNTVSVCAAHAQLIFPWARRHHSPVFCRGKPPILQEWCGHYMNKELDGQLASSYLREPFLIALIVSSPWWSNGIITSRWKKLKHKFSCHLIERSLIHLEE